MSHTKTEAGDDQIICSPDHRTHVDPSQTHILPKMLILTCFSRPLPPNAHDNASHQTSPPAGAACPSLGLPPRTLWHHACCLQLSGSLGRVESGWNNQPILGSLNCPVTLGPSPRRQHQPHCHRPRPVRYNPTWMHNLPPHSPALALEENAGHILPFPESQNTGVARRGWATRPLGHCTSLRPASLPSAAPQGGSPGPWTLGALLRKAGCFLECGPGLGRGLGSARTVKPWAGRACGLAPGLPLSPFCSELGADSASQDTSPQSACEGGPCRPGLLHPLPRACEAHLGPTLGPFPWTLTHSLAKPPAGSPRCSWKQPLQTHCPRPGAESRWGRGCRRPQPASPFFVTFAGGAASVDILNLGLQISFGAVVLGGGS